MAKDSPRIRGTTPQIQQAARHLRQNLTPAEAKLWSVLQKRQQNGLKFRCQHPLGRFIVDFYCPTYKLIIEIDGPIHKQQQHYDQARTEQLEAFGYRVLRLTNQQVLDDLTTALTLIKTAIKTLSPPEYALRAAARGGGRGAWRAAWQRVSYLTQTLSTGPLNPPMLGDLELY
jgi:very-short-patch-repair endonuclease